MGRSKIEYEGWVFTGSEIRSGKIYSTISLLQSELEPNSFEAEVECTDSSILSFQRNAPLRYYNDDILTGIFYVQSIKRTSASTYTIEADSAIGILAEGQHYGGIYTGETVEEILPSICGSVPYILHFSFAKIALYGWLPIATPRDNLAQVLFAIGATVKTDRKGILRIESLWDGISGNVGKDKLFEGPKASHSSKVTRVAVTEHQYVQGTEEADLFEGATQSGDIITFSEPMHSLTASGFTILESGANYAKVSSGTGTLKGKKYIHNTRQISRNIEDGRSQETENVKSVTEATLVSLVNSSAVANRLKNYYTCSETIDGDIVLGQLSPGDVVTAYHPYDEVNVQACIESLDITVSGTLRAKSKQLVGYRPLQIEQTVIYDEHELLTGSGEWAVPEGVSEVRIVLISGGQAGYNGQSGEKGTAGGNIVRTDSDHKTANVQAGQSGTVSVSASTTASGGSAGQGGEGGASGIAGNVLQTTISVNPGDKISYSCGTGGVTNGATGGQTTFGDVSSENGGILPDGYTDIVTGITYAKTGSSGGKGGAGGSVGASGAEVDGVPGGSGYSRRSENYPRSGKETSLYDNITWNGSASYSDGGAGGGGAGGSSGNSNGSPGGNASYGTWSKVVNLGFVTSSKLTSSVSGSGGRGANGAPGETYGSAGSGGGGGGGGGANGDGSVSAQFSKTSQNKGTSVVTISETAEVSIYPRNGGAGGAGGSGGSGKEGCIILYYGKKTEIKPGKLMDKNKKTVLDKNGRLIIV